MVLVCADIADKHPTQTSFKELAKRKGFTLTPSTTGSFQVRSCHF
jgi:hypothetical protein